MFKFKVGDMVKVISMDRWSAPSMEGSIGKIGIVKQVDDSDKVNGYLIQYIDELYSYEEDGWWFMEDSLELVKFENEGNMISKEKVLKILALSNDIFTAINKIKEL